MFRTEQSRCAKPSGAARLRLSLAWVLAAMAALTRCAPASPRPVLGANVDLSALDSSQRAMMLDRLASADVTSVRMELDWNRVEPKQGKFAWAPFDAAVDAARARGMEVVLVLGPCATWAVNPAWQVPADQKPRSVPKSLELWRRYVKAAVSHFRNRVRCWQVREQPNARNFRGARSEYLALLDAAAKVARSLDPNAVVIAPEAGFLDIAAVERFLGAASGRSTQVVGVHLPADVSRIALPWAVLTHEIMGSRGTNDRKPVWVLGLEDGASPDACATDYLLAWAFGAERCYLPPDAISGEWTRPLLDLTYQGFASPAPGAWMLLFAGPNGPVAAAWCPAETVVSPPAPRLRSGWGEAERSRSPAPVPNAAGDTGVSGAASSASQPADSGLPPLAVPIGPRPTLFPGSDWLACMHPGAPTRSDVLAARGCASLANLPMVYMDCSMPEHPEVGLANRALRTLGGGACVEEQRQGRNCIHTSMTYREEEVEQDNPWLYFDVDDSWLYFGQGKTRLVVTVECEGSYLGAEKLGFNIVYDSTTGYRFSPWQWVGPGYGWRSYRVELTDVNFSNRDGWDFRINAKGSVQDLWVSAVTVEKVPLPEPPPAVGGFTVYSLRFTLNRELGRPLP